MHEENDVTQRSIAPESASFEENYEAPDEGNQFLGKARTLLILAGISLAVMIGTALYSATTYYPKRFDAVVEGKLYRSGEVHPAHLARLTEEKNITRVICLLNPDAPETQAEREAAEKLNLEWINLPMGGSGQHTEDQIPKLIDLLLDGNAPPTLVHCAAGVNRTGLAVGLYRIHHDGWTYEQVYEELLSRDFDDLPKHEQMRATLRAEAERVARMRSE